MKVLENPSSTQADLDDTEQLLDKAIELNQQSEALHQQRRKLVRSTDMGVVTQIQAGHKELETTMKECNKPGNKRADNKVNYAWFRTLESQGKGMFDPMNSSTHMTNVNGMNCLKNFKEVTKALIGMCPPENPIHEWLNQETVKWEELAEALFDVQIFLKSQKKRDPALCDDKLYVPWKVWQKAFPG